MPPSSNKPWKPYSQITLSKDQANWRGDLRARVGTNGEKLWEIILGIAQGEPLTVQLPDGRESISVPNPDTRLKAAVHLTEVLFGKAVSQTEQKQAEDQADELKALGDVELERKARDILARGLQKLDQKILASGTDIASGSDRIGSGGTLNANAKIEPKQGDTGGGTVVADRIDSTGPRSPR